MKLTNEEAKATFAKGGKVYEASCDGETWSGGRAVEFGEVLGYFTTKKEAEAACREHKRFAKETGDTVRTTVEKIDDVDRIA